MARDIFLSFLGASRYTAVSYPHPRKPGAPLAAETPYVQEAFLEHLRRDGVDPEVYLFVTPSASERNLTPEDGLGQRLRARNWDYHEEVIEDPGAEDTIWRTFERVTSVLQSEDRVWFDVTHAFRILPMLGIVALNYARALKNIYVEAIWYGEYYPNADPPSAPATRDVTAFVAVQDWSVATRALQERGSVREFAKLSDGVIRRGATEGKKAFGRRRAAFQDLRRSLTTLAEYLELANAHALVDAAAWDEIRVGFADLRREYAGAFGTPARPVLDLLTVAEHKLAEGFAQGERRTAVVRWAVDHDLIQQGFTMLDELVTTTVCELAEADPGDKPTREYVAAYLKLRGDTEFDPARYALPNSARLLAKITAVPSIELWRALARANVEPRNALNHAGYDRRAGHLTLRGYQRQLGERLAEFEQLLAAV